MGCALSGPLYTNRLTARRGFEGPLDCGGETFDGPDDFLDRLDHALDVASGGQGTLHGPTVTQIAGVSGKGASISEVVG